MANWLPWAMLVFVAILLAAMPWRRPHPNHEFMLDLLSRFLDSENEDGNASTDSHSSRSSLPLTERVKQAPKRLRIKRHQVSRDLHIG